MGARESLINGRNNFGEGKSRTRRGAPGDTVLPDQFQMGRVVLTSDRYHKTFVYFCQIREYCYSIQVGVSKFVKGCKKFFSQTFNLQCTLWSSISTSANHGVRDICVSLARKKFEVSSSESSA